MTMTHSLDFLCIGVPNEEASEATICRFMIDYKFQGKGLGQKSFKSILDWLKTSGVQTVNLMLDDTNQIAKKSIS